MPVFEKSQSRKFTPIHYEPLRKRKEEGESRTGRDTDFFLQRRDLGIRYMDWAGTPQKDAGKRSVLHERASYWKTFWEVVCHWFRKPSPLLEEERREERKESWKKEPKKKNTKNLSKPREKAETEKRIETKKTRRSKGGGKDEEGRNKQNFRANRPSKNRQERKKGWKSGKNRAVEPGVQEDLRGNQEKPREQASKDNSNKPRQRNPRRRNYTRKPVNRTGNAEGANPNKPKGEREER